MENQIEETNLFDTDESQDEVTAEVEETPTEAEVETEPFLTITYLQDQKGLSKDEAISYAQKGMNYDHLNSKYEQTLNNYNQLAPKVQKYDDLMGKLENYASSVNLDVNSYLDKLSQLNLSVYAQNEYKALKSQYEEADDRLLQELALDRAKAKLDLNQKQFFESKQQQANSVKSEDEYLGQMIDKFTERYPGVDVTKLDKRVYDTMNKGYTLLEAYQFYLQDVAQERKQQEEIEKQNVTNKSKSYGNTNVAENVEKDDFLSGFLID